MSFETLATNRYSCRSFSTQRVDPALVDKLLEVALLAPTAANRWPLHLYVIESDQAIEGVRNATRYHFDATLFILVCYDQEKVWERRVDGENSGIDDASIVGCHLMFEVEELGLGTTWVKHFDPEALREGLSLPDHLVPVCLFPIGYKAPDAEPAKSHTIRPRVEDVVSKI
ncbi:MAG TPA: nitroreductase [Fastidiosipila sp.]|nr:nitroreductase [Fastidiosipila sp.]